MKFEESKQSGPHAKLAAMVGKWKGTNRTWFKPGELAEESEIEGETRLILDGRFLMHEYKSTLGGQPMLGVTIHGYSTGEDQWQSVCVDSVHNGTRILYSTGDGANEHFNALASYPAPSGPDWGWRTELTLPSRDNLIVRHFNITPDGQEALAVEFDYQRA